MSVFFAGELIVLTIIICQKQQAIKVLAAFILSVSSPSRSMNAIAAGPRSPPRPIAPQEAAEDAQLLNLALLQAASPSISERQLWALSKASKTLFSPHWIGLADF